MCMARIGMWRLFVNDNHLTQMQGELSSLKGTALYGHLSEGLQRRWKSLWKKLLTEAKVSSDSSVKGTALAIIGEAEFDRLLANIESPGNVSRETIGEDDNKVYKDYPTPEEITSPVEMEFR